MNKDAIDCILFSFNQKSYILPAVAFVELGALHGYQIHIKDFRLGTLLWRGLDLPLIRPDLNKANARRVSPKFAVLNALGVGKISYFAILVDNRPSMLKINSESLIWQDHRQKIAIYQKESLKKEVILIDIKLLSKTVENHFP